MSEKTEIQEMKKMGYNIPDPKNNPEYPYCTKCGQQANNPCIYTGKENWFTGHCIKCDNDNAEFVGNSEQYYEGDDYADLY